MGHQTFTCCICGEQTTKPKSYAIPDKGRACRSHQEAQDARSSTLDNEKKQAQDRIDRENERLNRFKFQPSLRETLDQLGFRNPRTYCWCCEKDGVSESQIALRRVILLEKHSIKGEIPNIFDLNSPYWQELREEFKGKKVIKTFEVKPDYPEWKLKQILPMPKNPWEGDKLQLIRFTHLLILCTDCAQQYEFDWNWDQPQITEASLVVGHMLYKDMEPFLKAIASDEIAKEEIDKASQRTQSA